MPWRWKNPSRADVLSGDYAQPCATPVPPPVSRPLMAASPLLLIGAGGFARETVELVRAINREAPEWELLGLLDDDPAMHGREILGLPVLGSCASAAERPQASVVACVASPEDPLRRLRLVDRVGLPRERYATLLHPRATIPASATIGPGSVVHANVVLTADVELGAHVAVMPAVVLTHDDVVGDGVTFGAGAKVSGAVRIESGAYIGSGALLRERISVGSGAVVGMGAVVDQVGSGRRGLARRAGAPGSTAPPAGGDPVRLLVAPHDLEIGGSQINAIDLAAGAAEAGHDVIVYGQARAPRRLRRVARARVRPGPPDALPPGAPRGSRSWRRWRGAGGST